MPEIDFDPTNRKSSTTNFDRLKLKKGESGRIVLLNKPTFAYVHTLRAPQIVNGKAVKTTKQRTNKDGEVTAEYEDYAYDFIGRPLCLGDLGILADKGLDPDNCPVCKRAREGDQVNPPERRFAVNVIRYATQADGKLVTPFSCSCVVWSFNEGTFNKLLSIAEEYAEVGGLIGRDLLLGPCKNEAFQTFEISVGAKNAWQLSEDFKARVQETFKQNKVDNLEAACGRQTDKRWILNDLETIEYRYRIANGTASTPDGTEAHSTATLAEGIDDLLSDDGGPRSAQNAPAPEQQAVADTSGLDLLGDTPPAAPPAAAKPATSGEAFDFDKVLGGLSV